MDVGSVSSQSSAVAAYAAQLSARDRVPPPPSNNEQDQAVTLEARRGDQVSLSEEARRLADPNNSQQVAQDKEPPDAQRAAQQSAQVAARPEDAKASAAKSVAQAINAYLETSVV
jgi:hypothetical protein